MSTVNDMTRSITMPESSMVTGCIWLHWGTDFLTKFISTVKHVASTVINRIFNLDNELNESAQRSMLHVPDSLKESPSKKEMSSKQVPATTTTTASNNHGEENPGFDETQHASNSSMPCLPLGTRANNYRQVTARPPPRKPSKSRFPSNTVSAASTEMPVDMLGVSGSNQSIESRKTVHRKSTTEVARVLSNAITSQPSMCVPLQSPNFHRRCQSTRILSSTEYFARLLRTAIYRKEANTVRDLLCMSIKHTDDDVGTIICNAINEEGYTLVHSAVLSQSRVILSSLLEALPSETIRKEAVECSGGLGNKYSPLHLAALKENFDAASILLEHGADPNAKSKLGTSPLHLAINTCNCEMVKLLLAHGADPNAVSLVGNTPLTSAVRKKSMVLVESLLKAGANPRASVGNGMSAKALALEMNATDILEKMDGSLKLKGQTRTTTMTTTTPMAAAH